MITMCEICLREGRFNNTKGSKISESKCECGGKMKTMSFVREEDSVQVYRKQNRWEMFYRLTPGSILLSEAEYYLMINGIE